MAAKARLLHELSARVAADLAVLVRQQHETQAGATHEESRAEHAKDTRATEQAYLARGLAQRVQQMRRTIALLTAIENRDFGPNDAIALMALVELRDVDESATQNWWLVPGAGGIELSDRGRTIRTLTPAAALGKALLGLRVGDAASLSTPRGERSFEILGLA